MKKLMVIDNYLHTIGGGQFINAVLVESCKSHGLSSILLTTSPFTKIPTLRNIPTYRASLSEVGFCIPRSIAAGSHKDRLRDFLLHRRLIELAQAVIKLEKPDILFSSFPIPLVELYEATGILTVYYILSAYELPSFHLTPRNWLRRALFPILYGRREDEFHRVICRLPCLLAVSRHIQAMAFRVLGVKAKVVYPPIRPGFFPVRYEDKKDYVVSAATSFTPAKALDKVVKLYRRVKTGTKLVLVGRVNTERETRYYENIIRMVKKIGLRDKVVLVGNPTDETYKNLLRMAKCFLYARGLYEDTEPFGMVITEALASGTPVIAPDKGGPAEAVRTGVDGFLVKNEEEFAAKLQEILGDEDLRRKVSMNAVEGAKRFSADLFASEMIGVLKSLI